MFQVNIQPLILALSTFTDSVLPSLSFPESVMQVIHGAVIITYHLNYSHIR